MSDDWYDIEHRVRYDPTLPASSRILELLKEHARYPHTNTFVETGTANGDTCAALHNDFRWLYTIEIVPSVYEQTKQRLAQVSPTIHCLFGDSTDVLPEIPNIHSEPCMFWLDGHYCGSLEARGPKDTPVVEELQIIMATGQPHVILIDDARLFGTDPAYPTLEWVREFVTTQDRPFSFSYDQDVIRVVPR
jgi:hypothetical protein